jgi:hypothetical protein
LIAQVTNNKAPAALQAAFAHLVGDLQALHGTPAPTGSTTGTPAPTGATGTGAGTTGAGTSSGTGSTAGTGAPATTPPATTPATTPSKPAITLQALLTLMQQTLGYGASSQPSATGGLLNVQA